MDTETNKRDRLQTPEDFKLFEAWDEWIKKDLCKNEELFRLLRIKGGAISFFLLFDTPKLGKDKNTIVFPDVDDRDAHIIERDIEKLKRYFCEKMGWDNVNIQIEKYDGDARHREWEEKETAKTLQGIREKCANNRLFFGALSILIWQLCKNKKGKYKIWKSMGVFNWQREDLPSCDVSKNEHFDPIKEECYSSLYPIISYKGGISELDMLTRFIHSHSFDSIEQAKREIADGLFDDEVVKALDILNGDEEAEWKDVSFEKLWNYMKPERVAGKQLEMDLEFITKKSE